MLVHDVIGRIAVHPAPHLVGQGPDGQDVGAGEEALAILDAEAFSGLDPGPDVIQAQFAV